MSNLEKKRDLERLREMAINFDEDERKVVLDCIPINELIDALKVKSDIMIEKLDHVQSLIDQFNN